MKLFIHLKIWRDICDKIWAEMKGDVRHTNSGSQEERESSKILHLRAWLKVKHFVIPALEKWSRKKQMKICFSVTVRK